MIYKQRKRLHDAGSYGESRNIYDTYYLDQCGSGVSIFAGARGQRGHGLGSLLGGLFRRALPMLKRGLAVFGKHALKTGIDIASDVAGGESVKESAKRRVPEGIKRAVRTEIFSNQSGSGRRRFSRSTTTTRKRKRVKNKKKKKKKKKTATTTTVRFSKVSKRGRKRRRKNSDIFS